MESLCSGTLRWVLCFRKEIKLANEAGTRWSGRAWLVWQWSPKIGQQVFSISCTSHVSWEQHGNQRLISRRLLFLVSHATQIQAELGTEQSLFIFLGDSEVSCKRLFLAERLVTKPLRVKHPIESRVIHCVSSACFRLFALNSSQKVRGTPQRSLAKSEQCSLDVFLFFSAQPGARDWDEEKQQISGSKFLHFWNMALTQAKHQQEEALTSIEHKRICKQKVVPHKCLELQFARRISEYMFKKANLDNSLCANPT